MGVTMYSIDKICGAIAGVKALIFADMTNVQNYGPSFLPPAPGTPPAFVDTDLIYAISFEKYSASVSKDSKRDQGGDTYDINISAFVPRSRSEVEILLARMRNRFLLIIAIDRYDNQHIMYNAQRSFHHTTGDKPGTAHGYRLSFDAPGEYLLPSIAGNGDIETAPHGPGYDPPGDGDCCVTIQPVKIAYYPAPSGNGLNHNQLVTTNDDTVYFIDGSGRSVVLNRPAPRYYKVVVSEDDTSGIIHIPSGYPLPNPATYASPTYDHQSEISRRLWIKIGPRWIQYLHDEGWHMVYASRDIHFETLISGSTVEFYFFDHFPGIPL